MYAIGGDGAMRGLVRIFEGVRRLGVPMAVAGVPKTVDNNVGIIDRSFGFHTAVEAAQRAIAAAHVEAESAAWPRGAREAHGPERGPHGAARHGQQPRRRLLPHPRGGFLPPRLAAAGGC